MTKRIWWSVGLAMLLVSLLTLAVYAQNTDLGDLDSTEADAEAALVQIEPITAAVQQQVPVTVTLRIPLGTTGTQTVSVPMLLSFNLQLSLSDLISPSLVLTASATQLESSTQLTTAVTAPTATPLSPTATPGGRREGATLTPTPVGAAETPVATPTLEPTATPAEIVAEPTATEPATTELTTTTTTTTTAPVTTTTTTTETDVVILPDCADPRSVIVFPGTNQTLSGTVEVLGTATHENFNYFKLEYIEGSDANAAEFKYLGGQNSPVEGGTLAAFNTNDFVNGLYTLRLTVVDSTGNFPPPCLVTVNIQN